MKSESADLPLWFGRPFYRSRTFFMRSKHKPSQRPFSHSIPFLMPKTSYALSCPTNG